MPLEQAQAEASIVMQHSNKLFPKLFEDASRENLPGITRFRRLADCEKIRLCGEYFGIYGMGLNFSSFVKYERVPGGKKNKSNSFDDTWLEGGLVFSGFSTPDCELARLGFLEEGCHLVGYANSDIRFFRPIRGFKEDYDANKFLGGPILVFRNVAKAQAIEVMSA